MIVATALFYSRIRFDPESDCHLWIGTVGSNGYGRFSYYDQEAGRTRLGQAHRLAYELQVGPIPAGWVIDHLCRVRNCVNPQHLEAVTQRVNIARGISPAAIAWRRGTCPRGHEWRERKAGGHWCPTCTNAATKARQLAQRRANGIGPRVISTHCPKGHEFTQENTMKRAKGRQCRECNRIRCAERYVTYKSNKKETT